MQCAIIIVTVLTMTTTLVIANVTEATTFAYDIMVLSLVLIPLIEGVIQVVGVAGTGNHLHHSQAQHLCWNAYWITIMMNVVVTFC